MRGVKLDGDFSPIINWNQPLAAIFAILNKMQQAAWFEPHGTEPQRAKHRRGETQHPVMVGSAPPPAPSAGADRMRIVHRVHEDDERGYLTTNALLARAQLRDRLHTRR